MAAWHLLIGPIINSLPNVIDFKWLAMSIDTDKIGGEL